MDCSIFDEEKVASALEPLLAKGNCVLDFHTIDIVEPSSLDLVAVLRADTEVLYDRLEKRGYETKKVPTTKKRRRQN